MYDTKALPLKFCIYNLSFKFLYWRLECVYLHKIQDEMLFLQHLMKTDILLELRVLTKVPVCLVHLMLT